MPASAAPLYYYYVYMFVNNVRKTWSRGGFWTKALPVCAPKTGGKDRVGQNGTIWDGNRDFCPIWGNFSYGGTRIWDNLGQNGTAVGKFCPVETSNCLPRVPRSRIAVLDSCAATKSLQPVATALHRQGNRVLNAEDPISRHSRACRNPTPRLPSHQELKEEPHSHLHRHSDQFCVLTNKTRLP